MNGRVKTQTRTKSNSSTYSGKKKKAGKASREKRLTLRKACEARYRGLQQQSSIDSDEKGNIGKTETRGLSERVRKHKRHTITQHATISNSSKTKGKKRQVERVRCKGCEHRLNNIIQFNIVSILW